MDPTLKDEVRFITTRLGAIIREQEGPATFERVERLRSLAQADRRGADPNGLDSGRDEIEGLSLAEAYAVAHAASLFFQLVNLCEERTRVRHLARDPEPRQSFRALFRELREAGVPPARVQACLDRLEVQPVLTAHPTEAKRQSVLHHLWRLREWPDDPGEILEALWQTAEVRANRIEPLDEVENTLTFFDRSIFSATAQLYDRLEAALAEWYPELRCRRDFLEIASWVGGDRDGHPHVTPEVSRRAVERHRERVLAFYAAELDLLHAELSHSQRDGGDGLAAEPQEPFRRAIAEIRARLATYRDAAELAHDLGTVREGLTRQGAVRAASGRIRVLERQVRVFGYHLAELDFRDHSGKLADEPDAIREELRTIREIQHRHGPRAAHRFVLSMTHSAKDVLALLALAREVGTTRLDLVPLFETTDDLARAGELMREVWSDAGYREHLDARGGVQEIMLGYSDSNKDGGYLAANWFLHRAQDELAEAADAAGVAIRLFHGKGGPIDRGGGQSHEVLRAHPNASHGGRLRITEQGEVISLKYSTAEIAERNFEQLTSAVIASDCLPPPEAAYTERWEDWTAAMAELAESSRRAYRALVAELPEFPEYLRQATPIDLIEELKIGSRPSRRGGASRIEDLRAIPWVFSWTQSRHLLSSWYGVGCALEGFCGERPDGLALLRDMHSHWPFFRSLVENSEMSLAKTDLRIASRYADLVRSDAVREAVFGRIREEHARAVRWVLSVSGHDRLLEAQPVLAESIRLRNPYVDPLHEIQIHFLARWREQEDGPERDAIRRLLALTAQGIAFAMKSTG